MGSLVIYCILCIIIPSIYAPPPNRQAQEQQVPPPNQQQPDNDTPQKPLYQFAYSRYLETVVKILESDPKFSEKLRNMKEEDIKAGKVADHIDDLHQNVFDELTKAKIAEIERLREEIGKQIEKDGGAHNIKVPDHLDVENWEKFNKEDLRKLIVRTVSDMEEMDKQRKEEFKQYEMKKKAEQDHKLAVMSPEERATAETLIVETEKRHNNHEKLNHPGGREQLEEVWEEKDQMEKDNFDPRTFFALHDLNGDGFWNDNEIEALFQIEIDKLYNNSNPDDDPRERIEEMYRMREHVIGQMDKNKDRLISLDEFLQDNEAQAPNKRDEGWKDLADQQIYTDEELKRFEAEYAKQQGWGDHAYDPTPLSTPVPYNLGEQQHAQQPVAQQQQHQPVQQQVHVQPPVEHVQQLVQQQVVQPVPVQQQQFVAEQVAKKVVDPGYGI